MARTGRPRNFDEDKAVEGAMLLFWEQGYEGVSVDELRQAMGGLSTASIYTTFGSKRELFCRALDHYARTFGKVTEPLFDISLDPRDAIEQTLRGSAKMQSGVDHPSGCMVALSSTLSPPSSVDLKSLVASQREKNRLGIRRCVERANVEYLIDGANVEMLAIMIDAFLLGMSTQIRDGVSQGQLQAAIDGVMHVWDMIIASR